MLSMNFYNSNDIPRLSKQTVFQFSKLNSVMTLIILWSAIAFLVYVGLNGGYVTKKVDFPVFLAYWFAGVLFISSLIVLSVAKARFRPSNWVIKYSPDWVTIKFRSYLNSHFSKNDIQAFGFSPHEIEWVRIIKETLITSSSDSNVHQFLKHLDLKLKDSDLSLLDNYLKEERQRKYPVRGKKIKYHDYPISLKADGVIRIQFNGLKPGADILINLLSSFVTVRETVKEKTDFTSVNKLSKAEQENKIIQLLERGRKMQAVKVAKDVYNMKTTKAKQFVEELIEKT